MLAPPGAEAPSEGVPFRGSLRGFCHDCGLEIIARHLEDGNFECPTCGESCVECPYESFEHWQGTWDITLEDGSAGLLAIAEGGSAVLTWGSRGTTAARLLWAPDDHEGFTMRLEGHTHEPAQMHLRLDGDAGIAIRRERIQDGTVVTGRGHPSRAGSASADSRATAAAANPEWARSMNSMFANIAAALATFDEDHSTDDEVLPSMTGTDGNAGAADYSALQQIDMSALQETLDQGLGHMATAILGLRPAEADHFRRLARSGPLLRAVAEHLRGLPIGMRDLHLEQLLGPLPVTPHLQQQDQAVPMEVVTGWLEAHGFETFDDLEPDWQCPICFDTEMKDLVATCQNSHGRLVHVFHRQCIASWLGKRNQCPTCRRAPVVTEASAQST